MKKILFLLLLVPAMSANAQTFDEKDLIGTWITTGLAYPAYKITNIESITFGPAIYSIDEYNDRRCAGIIKNMTTQSISKYDKEAETDNYGMLDYFISNNNKLHFIVGDDYGMHFIIEELSATTLKVKTYDGQAYTFTKDNSSSVRSVGQTRSTDTSTYNLSGQKVENITTDGVFIQNGQKKLIRK